MSNLLIREGRAAEILLVEDNRGDAMLASRAFKTARIDNHLIIAETGEKALSILRKEGDFADTRTPDLVLLDLNLPKMSGKQVLAAIKGDEKLKHIPVIVLSSSEAETDVAGSYDGHANAYIVKPIDLAKFRDVVSSIEEFFFMLAVLPADEG